MFAHKGIKNSSLERHILSFLVDGNIDIFYPSEGVLNNDSLLHTKTNSTLAIIRQVNRGARDTIKSWQDKFQEFNQYLSSYLKANPQFKPFYKDYSLNGKDGIVALVQEVLNPVLNRFSSAPAESLIKILKETLAECNQWKKCPDQIAENKDVLVNSKVELRKLYVSLRRLRESIPGATTVGLQNAFKFLLFERIAYLLFKNERQITDVIIPIRESKAQAPRLEREVNRCRAVNKCLKWGLLLPSVVLDIVLLIIWLKDMENGSKGMAFSCSTSGSIALAFLIFCCFRDGLIEIKKRYDTSLTFQKGILGQLDRRYGALEQKGISEETKSVALNIQTKDDDVPSLDEVIVQPDARPLLGKKS